MINKENNYETMERKYFPAVISSSIALLGSLYKSHYVNNISLRNISNGNNIAIPQLLIDNNMLLLNISGNFFSVIIRWRLGARRPAQCPHL